MKLAMVTTARAERSAVGGYSLALAAELARRVDLTVFVDPDDSPLELPGLHVRPADQLFPREFDQLLHQVGDEAALAFTAPLIRALGGVVALHDWNLFHFASAAYPALQHGGLRAFYVAVREGGVAQARELRRASAPALNRSAVRFGDAFVTHSPRIGEAILTDRNAPTPIVVLEPKLALGNGPRLDGSHSGAESASTAIAGAWSALADSYLAALERFPRPRSARRALIALAWAPHKRREGAN